ncbi:MAG: restriction endonuclease subunit S [Chlamydiia bacterium]
MLLSRNLSGCQVFHADRLPAEWECDPLGERIELCYGRALKDELRKDGHVLVYGSNGSIGTHNVEWLPAPGIIIGRKGSVGAVHLAKTHYWPIDTAYYLKATEGDNFSYLLHLLQYLPLKSLNAATGVPGLSRRDAYALRGSFPRQPLEQAAIAHILDAVDTAIERARSAVDEAEVLVRSLIQSCFEYGLDANGRIRSERCIEDGFTESEIGLLPPNWTVKRLSEVAHVERGKFTPRPRNDPRFYNGAYPFLQTGEIARAKGRIVNDFTQSLNEAGKAVSREFPKGTIIITIAANIGETAILGRPMCAPDSLVGVQVYEPNSPRFIELCLRRLRPRLQAIAPRSAQANINLTTLRPLRIPVPNDPEEQLRIAALVDEASEYRDYIAEKVMALLQLKKSLMHDLLTGRVRVPTNLTESEPTIPPQAEL